MKLQVGDLIDHVQCGKVIILGIDDKSGEPILDSNLGGPIDNCDINKYGLPKELLGRNAFRATLYNCNFISRKPKCNLCRR